MESYFRIADTRFSAHGPAETMPRERFPPIIAAGFACWQDLRARADASMPARAHLDPLELAPRKLLPNVMLWEVRSGPPEEQFLCRLAGEELLPLSGRATKGRTLAEANGPNFPTVYEEFAQVVADGGLNYCERTASWADRSHRYYARLLTPLGADGVVTHLLSFVDFFDADRVEGAARAGAGRRAARADGKD